MSSRTLATDFLGALALVAIASSVVLPADSARAWDEPRVWIYVDAAFKGTFKHLGEGSYRIDALGIPNDSLTSIKVPRGWTVVLYEHDNFKGKSVVVTEDDLFLYDFNDKTSSIHIRRPRPASKITRVTLYENHGFQGKTLSLGPGRHDMRALRAVGNDAISSLEVPTGWSVKLFEHAGFKGRSVTIKQTRPTLPRFNDLTSSVIISPPPKPDLTRPVIYEHVDFKGQWQQLDRGSYRLGKLTIGTDQLSSARVPAGWTVILYERDGFKGRSWTLKADAKNVGRFNDKASSIVVKGPPRKPSRKR